METHGAFANMTGFAIPELVSTLEWRQPRTFTDSYELHTGQEIVAWLWFEGLTSTRVILESPFGTWSFQEAGILDDRVLVHDTNSGVQVAVHEPKILGDGILILADGRRLSWQPTNLWATNWRFVDELGNQPVVFTDGVAGARLRDVFKSQATVAIAPDGWRPHELMLLVALGWYLILMRRRKTVVVASTT